MGPRSIRTREMDPTSYSKPVTGRMQAYRMKARVMDLWHGATGPVIGLDNWFFPHPSPDHKSAVIHLLT